jgi:hypothetical protein
MRCRARLRHQTTLWLLGASDLVSKIAEMGLLLQTKNVPSSRGKTQASARYPLFFNDFSDGV